MKSAASSAAPAVGLAAFLLLAASLLAPAAALRAQLNPMGKVLDLLQSLSAKITKEAEAEEKAFKEYVEWCDDASRSKQFEIKTLSDKKEQLEAKIAKATGDGQASAAKIEQLVGAITTAQGDLTSATTIREKESKDFAKSEAELVDVVDTLSRAIDIVSREMAKNPAFAQLGSQGATSGIAGVVEALGAVVDAAAFSSADKQKLLSLVQSRQSDTSGEDDEELGAPAATVYKTHSTGIIDTLEDLKETAEEQLSSLRKAETGTKHNFEMLKQSLEDQMAADTKSKKAEEAAAAETAELKGTAESDLAVTEKDLADAKAALETANSGCMSIAGDHEKSVAARTAELKVIADATKVLQNKSGGAVGQSYSMLQVAAGQRRSGSRLRTRADLANAEVVTLVKKLAARQHSGLLTQLANRIATVFRYSAAAHEDPFAKVKGLISDLIERLEQEAQSEATEKAYCDDEMAKTEEKKGELEFDIGKVTAKIEEDIATSATRKSEVSALQEELAALAKSQAEMDSQRQESHADYLQAKADLELGLEGVRSAIAMLQEFYGAAGEPAAMLQSGSQLRALMQQPEAPVFHSKAMGEGTSILGLLDVIESDFAKDLATEETAESTAAAEYDKMTQANKVTKTLKEQDVAYKTQEAKSLDKYVAELSSDRETLSSEQSAVLEYYAKLKERCIAKPETYEERKRRREAEITGLKEALATLENEAAFVQRGKRGAGARFLAARA